ncbi:MAG: TIGR02678 family protein [Planctomycetota bacterium]
MRARGARTALGRRLQDAELEERQRALRALLQRPLLHAEGGDAEAFQLVRRHGAWLQEWVAHFPGWSLTLDAERARLRKLPADTSDPTRPARDSGPRSGGPRSGGGSHQAFCRRRYVLFCLALAVLEREQRQTVLGRVAEQVVALVAEDPALAAAGIEFDLSSADQRRDLVQVMRLLLDLRVLVHVEGEEQSFVEDRGDVLYTIQRPALAALLQVRCGPSAVEAAEPGPEEYEADFEARLRAIAGEELSFTPGSPEEEEARTRRLRHSAYRRLLDDPVVYYDDLDSDERAYFEGQRGRLLEQVALATGLEPEVRAEGLAMVDERGDATDLGLPKEGTFGHLTLLLAEHLAERARLEPGRPVGLAALRERTAELIEVHGRRWSKQVRQPGAVERFTDEALALMHALRLVRPTPEGVVPRPAIARFALREDEPAPAEVP